MATITLKDIPRRVHHALKLRAKEHGRSLNREVLACLEMSVLPKKVDLSALLLDLRRHRDSLPGQLTDSLLDEAKNFGRP